MIDNIIVRGPLKPLEAGDYSLPVRLGIVKAASTTLRPADDFITSPIADAQMSLLVTIEEGETADTLAACLEIPLQSALLGTNWLHPDLSAIERERFLASRLARWALESNGFSPQEVNRFVLGAACDELELTWHIATASEAASKKLLYRIDMFFKTLHLAKSRHDIGIDSYYWGDWSQSGSLLVRLKNGTKLRFYRKLDEIRRGSKKSRRGRAVFPQLRASHETMSNTLGCHVRVEIIASKAHLKELRLSHPTKWSEASLRALIDDTFRRAGLMTPYVRDVRRAAAELNGLSESVSATLGMWLRGESLDGVSAKTITMHRHELLQHGIEIAVPAKAHGNLSSTLGRQVAYGNRYVVPNSLRHFIFSDASMDVVAPALEEKIAAVRKSNPAHVLAARAVDRHNESWHARRRVRRVSERPAVETFTNVDPDTGEISFDR